MSNQRQSALTVVLSATAILVLSSALSVLPSARAAGVTPAKSPGQTINVATTGDDHRSRTEAASLPLASIARAIRLAQPGDTIVVQQGIYPGAAGYGAVPANPNAPIRLQNAPGQRVLIEGTLQLDDADYWRVSGINVTQDPQGPRKEFLVKFDGGTGWQFVNAEVWGTKGVSNLMISGSAADGSPRDYLVSGDCIHDNTAVADAFMNDHDIYLMPGYRSGPGVIEHNLLFNAPNGAAIKAAGPSARSGAAQVIIRRNTIAGSAAGVIVGYGTNRVQLRDNLIGAQVKHPPAGARYVANYDAAVIGNHVSGPGNTAIGTAVWGFPHAVRSTPDSRRPIKGALTRWLNPRFDVASCQGFHPANRAARRYGRFS